MILITNAPIVSVMVPVTLRWAKRVGIPKEQLLMPLSYATILGKFRLKICCYLCMELNPFPHFYPYMLCVCFFSGGTCTLVGTSTNLVVSGLLQEQYPDEETGNIGLFDLAIYGVPNAMIGIAYMMVFAPLLLPNGRGASKKDDLLLGATVKPWSPAAGRTYKRSGLGNSAGIFLANVRRAATGNMHRAVSSDFVISAGDELYFTASVEDFGEFCEKHALEIITTDKNLDPGPQNIDIGSSPDELWMQRATDAPLDQLRQIRHMSDQIEGREEVGPGARPTQLLVALDETEQIVLLGVDCEDVPGLLKHISVGISEQGFNVRHSEARVFDNRSLSVWRCESIDKSKHPQLSDLDDLWRVVYQSLKESDRALVSKKSGSRVVRAYVTKKSRLIGKKPIDVDFRQKYKAPLIAYQKKGENTSFDAVLDVGDLLVLHTIEGSPLLTRPPEDFYQVLQSSNSTKSDDIEVDLDGYKEAWTDFKVVSDEEGLESSSMPKGEFLTAFTILPGSVIVGQTLSSLGYDKLPGVVVISVERPAGDKGNFIVSEEETMQVGDIVWYSGSAKAIADLQRLKGFAFYRNSDDTQSSAVAPLSERRLVQAVIAHGSPLVGQTVKDTHFRSVYGGVVLAIQRGSDRVHEHPANVKLKTGDVLLVEAGSSFAKKHEANYRTFALLSEVENSAPPRPRLFLFCVFLIIASLAVASINLRSLLITSSIAGIVMVSLGVLSQQEARDSLQWDLYFTVAAAFGVGNAMQNSGVAEAVAMFLVRIGVGLGIGGKSCWNVLWNEFCLCLKSI